MKGWKGAVVNNYIFRVGGGGADIFIWKRSRTVETCETTSVIHFFERLLFSRIVHVLQLAFTEIRRDIIYNRYALDILNSGDV
jgi:hypothetical protein